MNDIYVSNLTITKAANGYAVWLPIKNPGEIFPVEGMKEFAKIIKEDENDLSAIMDKAKISSSKENIREIPVTETLFVFKEWKEVIEFLNTLN